MTEAEILAKAIVLATESLDPDTFKNFNQAIQVICDNRDISSEAMAFEFIKLCEKKVHASDCATSDAPAYFPGPCNCTTVVKDEHE